MLENILYLVTILSFMTLWLKMWLTEYYRYKRKDDK